jgi:hypothetical protein
MDLREADATDAIWKGPKPGGRVLSRSPMRRELQDLWALAKTGRPSPDAEGHFPAPAGQLAYGSSCAYTALHRSWMLAERAFGQAARNGAASLSSF